MKKKVAIILHGLSSNGVDTMFANLSSHWDTDRFEMYYFLAVDPDAEQFCEERVRQNGCHVIHLHDLDGIQRLKWSRTLRSVLKEYGPFDVVHSNLSLLSGLNLMIARRAGIPVRIAHVHTFPGKAGSMAGRLYGLCMRLLLSLNVTCELACSAEAGKAAFGKHDFQGIENGIELDGFLSAGNRKQDREEKQGQYCFATVGRISPDKNPGFLLDVFDSIHRKIPDASLTWVGDGPQRGQIESKAAEAGLQDAVRFLGVRKDVPQILEQCDYFLFPSIHEGFGNALIEAQAAGLECFASDAVPGITDCGGVRFLSLALPAETWAEEIIRHIHSGKQMEPDLQKIKRFDIQHMADKLMNIYQGY